MWRCTFLVAPSIPPIETYSPSPHCLKYSIFEISDTKIDFQFHCLGFQLGAKSLLALTMDHAFAILAADGSGALAGLKADGSVIAWASESGPVPCRRSSIRGLTRIVAASNTFAVLKDDGSASFAGTWILWWELWIRFRPADL